MQELIIFLGLLIILKVVLSKQQNESPDFFHIGVSKLAKFLANFDYLTIKAYVIAKKRGKTYSNWPAKCPINAQQWSFLQRKYHFTPRELQLAIAVCRGCNNKQAAEKLEVEINTAKAHLAKLYQKVGVDNKILLLLKFLEDVG